MITHQNKVSIYNFIPSSHCGLLPVTYNSNWARVSCAPMALVVISSLVSTQIPVFYSAGRKKRQFCSSSCSLGLGSHVRGALPAAPRLPSGERMRSPHTREGSACPARTLLLHPHSRAVPLPSSSPFPSRHHRKHLKQPQKRARGVLSEPWRQQGNGTWAHWTANYASKNVLVLLRWARVLNVNGWREERGNIFREMHLLHRVPAGNSRNRKGETKSHRNPKGTNPQKPLFFPASPWPEQTEIKQGTESSANDFTKLNPSWTWPKKKTQTNWGVEQQSVLYEEYFYTANPRPSQPHHSPPICFFFLKKKKTQAGCNFQDHCLCSV